MSDDDPNRELCYGDYVILQDHFHNGYVTCRLQKTSQVMVEQMEFPDGAVAEQLPTPPVVMDCVFQIMPKQHYSEQDTYNQAMIRQRAGSGDSLSEQQLSILRQKRDDEIQQNLHIKKQFMGVTVFFGGVTQFLHVKTDSYICCRKEAADADKLKMKVTLDGFGSEDCWMDFDIAYKAHHKYFLSPPALQHYSFIISKLPL